MYIWFATMKTISSIMFCFAFFIAYFRFFGKREEKGKERRNEWEIGEERKERKQISQTRFSSPNELFFA